MATVFLVVGLIVSNSNLIVMAYFTFYATEERNNRVNLCIQ